MSGRFANGISTDSNKAIENYKKACDLGSKDYCYILASRYSTGKHVEADIPKAKEIFKRLCDVNYQDSCIRLKYIEE